MVSRTSRRTESAVRYTTKRRPRLWPAALISLGVHVGLLLGFNHAGRIETADTIRLEPENLHLFDAPPEELKPPEPSDAKASDEEAAPSNPQDLAAASLPEPVASMDITSVAMEIGPPPPPVAPRVDASSFSIPATQSRALGNGAGKHLEIFNLDQLDKKPEALVQSAPAYPFELKHAGITGQVVLRFIVNPHGRVIDPTVVASSHTRFDEPALQAIVRWKFKPGYKSGRAVNTRMEITMRYRLDGNS